MECQKVKNLLTAKEEGKDFLQKYIESKDRKYLQKAMEIIQIQKHYIII